MSFFRAETGENPRDLISQLEAVYAVLVPADRPSQELSPGAAELSRSWFQGDLDKRRHFLYTDYHEVEKMTNSLIIKWWPAFNCWCVHISSRMQKVQNLVIVCDILVSLLLF